MLAAGEVREGGRVVGIVFFSNPQIQTAMRTSVRPSSRAVEGNAALCIFFIFFFPTGTSAWSCPGGLFVFAYFFSFFHIFSHFFAFARGVGTAYDFSSELFAFPSFRDPFFFRDFFCEPRESCGVKIYSAGRRAVGESQYQRSTA